MFLPALLPGPLDIVKTQTVSIDLRGTDIVGWRGKRHAGLVDVGKVNGHDALDYWEPIKGRPDGFVLDPDEFYILASKEAVSIPENMAAEMAPIAPEIGDLEVRGRDVPFILRDGQPVAKLVFEAMSETPTSLYGQNGSHYQAQGLRLSKHFRKPKKE